MRFLIDACAGARLAEWLRSQNHDVVESRHRGLDPGDRILLQWAADENRVLVTMDKDFGKFLFVEDAPHCGLVRLPDVPARQRIALLEQVLERHTQDLSSRAVVTVRGGRIRVSRTP
jgi:predicted nuclease of predicted toxin-antitoxin system